MRFAFLVPAIAGAIAASLPALAQGPAKPESPGIVGFSLEAQVLGTQHENPDWGKLKGNKAAIGGRVTRLNEKGLYVAADARIAYGKVDFDTGFSKASKADLFSDLRALAGKRFQSGSTSIAPYLGFGWRRAVNSSDGMISVGGIQVDRRTNRLQYLPIGLDLQVKLGGTQYLEFNAEYDRLLRGTQTSTFVGSEAKNTQNYGNGYRFSLMYGSGAWAAGPFASHWKIGESTANLCGSCVSVGWFEPENKTTEAGLRVRYSFE